MSDQSGQLQPLFTEIAHYVLELRSKAATAEGEEGSQGAKKRKLNNGAPASQSGDAGGSAPLIGGWTGTTVEGISFSVPQRKKLDLVISASQNEGIKAVNPATSTAEFGASWKEIGMQTASIGSAELTMISEHVLCLPVPEKAQSQKNFVILPKRNADSVGDGSAPEPIVWTAANSKGRKDPEDAPTAAQLILKHLKEAKAKVIEPSDKEFKSQLQQATQKGETAYHVKAFQGSKDGKGTVVMSSPLLLTLYVTGYLFFLPTGILWGFKKPLYFFSFGDINSISYTSVLQRTFNLNISAQPAGSMDPVEHEFSMLDQADFAGIDAYIKRHGLNDESMAAQRKAQRLNINKVKGEEAANSEGEEEGELQRAEREAEMQAQDDDDDEDDENFDPGSEGESEGSGTSSEEESDEPQPKADGPDLVADELGSEAEEVEMSDEDEDDEA